MLKQAALLQIPQDADRLKLCLSLQSAYLTGLIGETSWREARPAFPFAWSLWSEKEAPCLLVSVLSL